ncbi:uncharacterized protein [Nicotiana sylvestris]|uniref:uncharacterized protein n=1 Tax=Nicotiana sylvestris TaxID=4096 RepID=UPI00388C546A
MTERFFAVNQVSFSKNDLPPEGAAHNKALHLSVKCEDYYVKRVMLDGGLGVDICPFSTLHIMEIGTGRIRPNNVYIRAFDGIKRDTLGEIDLALTIGPVEFEITFQVLDMDTSYNFLLGRPWIHATGVVPSTLHQMVKFEYEDREIVVHGEDKQSIYRDPSIRYLEAGERNVFAWSYDDMPGLGVDLVVHKLPIYPDCPPVQQKQRKFKTYVSDKIKEEITKQLKTGVIRVVQYTTWLANIVTVPKKDGKTRKPMPTGRLAKWQILLTEFDIVYITSTTMKAQALADHLAENPVMRNTNH